MKRRIAWIEMEVYSRRRLVKKGDFGVKGQIERCRTIIVDRRKRRDFYLAAPERYLDFAVG
jgi:hypothetical protein